MVVLENTSCFGEEAVPLGVTYDCDYVYKPYLNEPVYLRLLINELFQTNVTPSAPTCSYYINLDIKL